MSGAGVWRVDCDKVALIVKRSARPTESLFYQEVAPELREAGVGIPDLLWSTTSAENYWLVVEHLPRPAALNRPDEGVITALARLHRHTRGRDYQLPTQAAAYRWDLEMTRLAVSCFEPKVRAWLRRELDGLQVESDLLNEPWCWISGDPSAANWARREDGGLALFDWELFRPGLPAVDLAITVPGLPSREELEATARLYRQLAMDTGFSLMWPEQTMVRQMAIAKLWTQLAILAGTAAGKKGVPASYIDDLAGRLPAWVRSGVFD